MIALGILATATVAGLGGAAHCAAMCGPLTLALGVGPINHQGRALSAGLAFNLGRILAYALAGALGTLLTGPVLHAALPAATYAMRLVAALLLGLVGIGLLGVPGLLWLDRLLSPAWGTLRRVLAPLARAAVAAPAPLRPFLFGLLWLLMPCGLVYSMLLVAVTRDSATQAAIMMLAFGVGTTPAVLGLSLAGARVSQWLAGARTRRFLGLLILLAAVASAVVATTHSAISAGLLPAHPHHRL
ncbi:MAG: sulfite exporter TauE/SafE family protein [Pseudomonadota bacterium]|jgi:uncharacterized protein